MTNSRGPSAKSPGCASLQRTYQQYRMMRAFIPGSPDFFPCLRNKNSVAGRPVPRRKESADGRTLARVNGEPVTLRWKPAGEGTTVLAVSTSFVERRWLQAKGQTVWLRDESGRALTAEKSGDFVLRRPSETRLPRVLAVARRRAAWSSSPRAGNCYCCC
jgi:hypothetical protein